MTNRSPRHNFTATPGLALLFNRLATHTPILTKRGLSISFLTAFLVSLAGEDANAAILEADDDEERLEKVKRDRKKRLERQGVIKSSTKETGYLQDLVYKLSKVGKAIENSDLSTAASVFGSGTDTDWVQNANISLNKGILKMVATRSFVLTLVPDFYFLAVAGKDVESSKLAFVSSVSAFEKWSSLMGLVVQLKGL
ncbi:Thylakoid lumenal 16.5 kDa protein, chloroplastic [Glycine soja]|uniref:Thylakoid lumenal 16.5 kDa protein, chloroplastic n=1 Tax=Glycine soja TaxID=3848 RepID=A0A445I5N7_GLYSO|nr:Thylakoid lumenal 16.5 kDa protein, chloroplastic [Glycine soja]